MMIKSIVIAVFFVEMFLMAKVVNAAIYCYPHGMTTTCFTEDNRTFSTKDSHVKNPNITVVPQYHPYAPAWVYIPQQPRQPVPEQDFGECTLALGCIRGTR